MAKQYFVDTNPNLLKEWDFKKNEGLIPEKYSSHSGEIVWWICPQNHSYKMRIAHRTDGHGCPYCAGQKPIAGINDLATTNPELLEEWDFAKNTTLSPSQVMRYSQKKVWWKGKCGHEWITSVSSRAVARSSCPICCPSGTSFPEQACSYYLKQIFPTLKQRIKIHGKELDIYIDEIKTAVEYDGLYFHKGAKKLERDNNKDIFCSKEGIRLIRIREEGLACTISAENIFRDHIYEDSSLNSVISKLLSLLVKECNIVVDVSTDYGNIQAQYLKIRKDESLAILFPEISKEWDNSLNAPLTAYDIKPSSNRKAWWMCPEGHSYSATVNNRTRLNSGCPYCAGKKALDGVNDIFSTYPELKKEWDFEKNKDIDFSEIRPSSGKKVWWICSKCGYSWQAIISDRTGHDKTGCPACARKVVWSKHNDLETEYPDIAKMWCYKKNKTLPSEYVSGSSKRVWWQCKAGHVFMKPIYSMVKYSACPVCSNRHIIAGINDLATKKPELIKEWDFEKNSGIDPHFEGISSRKKAWWICPKGHSYCTGIINRTSKGTACPYCANKKIAIGETDLLSTNPELAREWDFEKNKTDITSISAGNSRIKVFWKCEKGHIWQEPVSNRIRRNTKCPYCFSRRSLTKGVNDLETLEPQIASEWDYERNGTLKPSDVMRGADKKVWWKCSKGHSYFSSINMRTSQGLGCPYCSGQKVLKGFNDLCTTDPKIAEEWNYKLNGDLSPSSISRGCNKKVWWVCPKGHYYDSTVISRTKAGTGCPYCSGHRVLAGYNDIITTHYKVAAEWNYELNGDLLPNSVSAGSNKKVWWKCHNCGNEWIAKIISRCKGGKCPKCKMSI